MGKYMKVVINLSKSFKNKFKTLIVVSLISVSILCLGGYLYLLNFSKSSSTSSISSVTAKTQETVTTSQVGENGIVNILLTGLDIGNTTQNSTPDQKRTDTIILINYNPKTGATNLVSIPRDTLVEIDGKDEKINAANIIGGQSLLNSNVENLLGVKINYYASIDYAGFDKLIDAIGGIDMPITADMNYDDAAQNLHIHFTKGTTVHLDGAKAEEFFRWRKNNNGTGLSNGDIGRIDDQHVFIEKVLEKIKTPQMLVKIPSILGIAPQYVNTDMTPVEILEYGFTLAKLNKSEIMMSTLKGTTPYIGGISYFAYSEKENKQLLSVLQGGTAATSDTSSAEELDKTTVKVEVLNGTNETGLVASYAAQLKKDGFYNVATGNGTKSTTSKIILNVADSSLISTIKSEFNIDNIVVNQQKSNDFDITVLLGTDYKSSIN
jgi:LCP family protein required for cell wall assembly